jgi:hypothetical protein
VNYSNLPQLVGLHGYARSGKDTIADGLEKYGYRRFSFAKPMKDALYALNPIVGADSVGRTYRISDVVDDLGWDEAKATMGGEPRRLLQRFGTEVAREQWDTDFWVEMAFKQITSVFEADKEARVVITDVRFTNEVEAIASLRPFSYLLKVVRPGTEPINAHSSDAGLPNGLFDSVVMNDDTIEYLHESVLDRLRAGR